MVIAALSRRPLVSGVRLIAMGIQYADHREDVVDRHLVAVLARLHIDLTIANHIRQA